MIYYVMMLLLLAMALGAYASNWPGWRGDGSGISGETQVPIAWSPTEHVAWKTPLPGEGNSSPIIWGNRIFLTASTDAGKKRWVLCLDTADGHLLWQKSMDVETPAPTYPKTGYAAPTPVTDGERVYAFFDAPGLVALDMQGNLLWTKPLGPFKAVNYNMGNSPVLCDGKVIICCDHSGDSFIAAFDAVTGEQRWRTARKQDIQFSTPLIITVKGKKQIVVNAKTVVAYDPDTGKELWSCRGMMDTVVPSAVYDHGLVYTASGRNGPAMAIDPNGQGDVSETNVRMQVAAGGPYVVSPIACPQLILPGDDGMMRLIDDSGKVVTSLHVNGHFSASPVAAGGNLYWLAENGDTHVVHVDKSTLKEIATNSLGEKAIASPAIANGRLYIRTAKTLFCISGTGGTGTVAALPAAMSLTELKKRYDEHPAPEGDDVAVRIAVVEALGRLNDPAAIPLLKDAASKDPHWDVSEAAVKALGQYGEAALPAFTELFNDWRPYFKVVGAQTFGRVKSAQAVPVLLKIRTEGFTQVRIASLDALAEIGAAHPEQAAQAIPALLDGVKDGEGVVRAAAVRGLGTVANNVGDMRPNIMKVLHDCLTDRNPLVSAATSDALLNAYKEPAEVVMKDRILYGEWRKAPALAMLHAGPIRMKFQDGELRYLYVGEKEIIRRIYFAVRDNRWDTVKPELSDVKIQQAENSFTITFKGTCKNDIADYSWTGEMTGTPEGKITFRTTGQAGMDFKSPRIGINILFGAESLGGQKYELLDKNGAATPGVFPAREVNPGIFVQNTQGIRYTTADGMTVSCLLTGKGFGIEDQRNYGDSSFKAYHGLDYPYFDVPKGKQQSDTLTLELTNAKAATPATAPIRVTLGPVMKGAKMPKLLPTEQTQKTISFSELNGNLAKQKGAQAVAWAYNPALHMTDDDMFMENLSTILDQVHTVRTVAPTAKIRIDPISFDSPYPRPARDPRNQGRFAAAWTAAMVGYLAQAGVDEAVFTLTPGPAQAVLATMTPLTGATVLTTEVTAEGPSPVRALAISGTLWLVNTTDQPQKVTVEKLVNGTMLLQKLAEATDTKALVEEKLTVKNGTTTIELAPFAVDQLRWGRRAYPLTR